MRIAMRITPRAESNFKNTIDSKMEDMQGYFDEYKKQPMTDREKEYFGAMTDKFSKYKDRNGSGT